MRCVKRTYSKRDSLSPQGAVAHGGKALTKRAVPSFLVESANELLAERSEIAEHPRVGDADETVEFEE